MVLHFNDNNRLAKVLLEAHGSMRPRRAPSQNDDVSFNYFVAFLRCRQADRQREDGNPQHIKARHGFEDDLWDKKRWIAREIEPFNARGRTRRLLSTAWAWLHRAVSPGMGSEILFMGLIARVLLPRAAYDHNLPCCANIEALSTRFTGRAPAVSISRARNEGIWLAR